MSVLDRYVKIKSLGEGAQGNVYLANDTKLESKVAIKSLHQSLITDSLHVKRFEEEARTLASFRKHPNIIEVYDIIVNKKGCYLIMEYFEGYPLDKYIRNITGPIPEKKALDIFIMILDAMNTIHNKNIIHRDIKPSNIMINDDSDIRLLDFGIAKNIENDAKLTKVGGSAGYTPMYMSPEHCNGDKITKYSDIYSLGVVLWQMLTGKAPYEGCSQGQIYLKVANEPLPPVQSIYQNVCLQINEIVQKATHKEPKKRYSSCKEFKKELIKLKDHLVDPETEFLYALSVEILDDIEAKICLNKFQQYGTKFSMTFENGSAVEIKVIKVGYKNVKQNIIITKNETLQFSLEKQKLSLLKIISESQNKLIPYIHRIKPNLLNLLDFLRLNIIWAIETINLKLNKNHTEPIKITKNRRIKIKKNIDKSLDSIKIHKKEYAAYLIIISLIIISFVSMFGDNKVTKDNIQKNPYASFKNFEADGDESKKYIEIPIKLSEASDSIIKIPIHISGTATAKDFKVNSDTIVIEPNKKIGFIKLNIFNDEIIESNETIEIELQKSSNINLGEIQNFTYTIINDDKKIKGKNPKKFTPRGVKYKKVCEGFDRIQYYHDGNGSYYKEIIKRNSSTCGFNNNRVKNNSNYYSKIINEEDPNYYTEIFDEYFITYNNIKRSINMKIYSVKREKLIQNITFKGKINNLYYDNKQIFTNKKYGAEIIHHAIDIRNPSNNVLGGPKNVFKQRRYLGNGDEKIIKIITN